MSLNMKKIGTVSMTAAALLAALWGVQADAADDNTPAAQVKVTATVTGKTCTPTWNATKAETVMLGNVADTALANVGDVGTTKPFTLSLNDCDSGVTKVNVWAAGMPDSADTAAFKNTASTGAASGVAVTLWGGDDQSTQLTPDKRSSVAYTVTDGAAAMTFLAKLQRTAAVGDEQTKDGAVESIATLYMGYE